MRILIACEESQTVCKAFRERGHEAYSADILEPSGGHPEWHILGDVLPYINGNCSFSTMDGTVHNIRGKWDLLIAHPPCTYLTVSGNTWFNEERYGESARERKRKRDEALAFFICFAEANCDHIAIENPIGYVSNNYKKPSQVIHPYYFGDPVRKATCLWLKNLPNLTPTNIVEPDIISTSGYTFSGPAYYATDENGKILAWNDPRTARIRSKTYEGFANAMAEQWGRDDIPVQKSIFDFGGSSE